MEKNTQAHATLYYLSPLTTLSLQKSSFVGFTGLQLMPWEVTWLKTYKEEFQNVEVCCKWAQIHANASAHTHGHTLILVKMEPDNP